jgi:predicted deacylase
VHRWGPKDKDRVYIQAALHADELPGILVANKLIELLDSIDVKGAIKKEIILIPT